MKFLDRLKQQFLHLKLKRLKNRPERENHGNRLISEKSSSRVLEAYRMARTNLFYSGEGEGGTVFGFTSASPNDGKSLTCANLAISFAMSGKSVLLVDCDMRKSTQKIAFGVTAENGLSEFLANVTAEPEIAATSYENLSLLTAGRCPPNPTELLCRPRFGEMIAKVKEAYDFVFVDLPPVGLISDATAIASSVDSYVLVVRMGESDYRLLNATVESIKAVGGHIAGFMLNDVSEGHSGRYGYGRYYSKYYQSYGTTEETAASSEKEK